MASHAPRARRLSGTATAPSGHDVLDALNVIYKDFGVNAEHHLYITLIGDLVVECMASLQTEDRGTVYFSSHRIFTPISASLDALLMITAHEMYHQIDRAILRAASKTAAT